MIYWLFILELDRLNLIWYDYHNINITNRSDPTNKTDYLFNKVTQIITLSIAINTDVFRLIFFSRN